MNKGGDVIAVGREQRWTTDQGGRKPNPRLEHGWYELVGPASVLDLYDPVRLRTAEEQGTADWSAAEKFFKSHFAQFAKNSGEGLVILSQAIPSPSLDRLRKRIKARFRRRSG